MLDTAILAKTKKSGDDEGMDVEETFGDNIYAPKSPLPESEIGASGLGEGEDEEGGAPLPEEPLIEDEPAEEW